VTAIRAQTHLAHLEENSALHWLESVSGIRKGSCVDYRIGVFQERLLHLGGNVNIVNSFGGRRWFCRLGHDLFRSFVASNSVPARA
jgi:hypothetical protein